LSPYLLDPEVWLNSISGSPSVKMCGISVVEKLIVRAAAKRFVVIKND
jgi:hypothetical protein